jgi:hypothetical protein
VSSATESKRADEVCRRSQEPPCRARPKVGPQGSNRAHARSLSRGRKVAVVRDLKALSQSIIDAIGELPADASADTRVSAVEKLIGEHVQSAVKSISSVGEYGTFLRDLGFAKGAVKKLAPAFKSISGDHIGSDELKTAALADLLRTVRTVAATLKHATSE